METKNMVIILAVVIVLAFFGYRLFLAPATPESILPADGEEEVDEDTLDVEKISQEVLDGLAVLLDVRTDAELAEDGYALNSSHFDVVRLEDGELPDFSKDMKVYVHCKSGGRAGKAETILEDNGWADVTNIGGLVDWIAAGGEIVK
jgi:rhodanese-related sulfurtransferase